ncbi:MAG: hypothetical protein ABUR63_07690 [Verrucomicrobiota bacterium]
MIPEPCVTVPVYPVLIWSELTEMLAPIVQFWIDVPSKMASSADAGGPEPLEQVQFVAVAKLPAEPARLQVQVRA